MYTRLDFRRRFGEPRECFGGRQVRHHPAQRHRPAVDVQDHAMWFHRTAEADCWMLYDQVSPSASGLLGFSMGRLMQDGKLIASCCQEGVMRLVDVNDLDASVTFPLGRGT
ncbi:acyl-CoA thioesterase domain-containing protein [Pseudoxanthomonas sacheonensis]|uniref:acyl-CoA thioesterase n=1 Tax=Pseudoxanthomonas sacheonensis TaxID=443615 RepID=UPI001BABA5F3|nr:acyl-CoA thioesterase domain-containing protein [Pseudoxanthomonas sacheonensis]